MKNPKFGDSQFEAHINLAPVESNVRLMLDLVAVGLKIVDLVEVKLPGLDSEEFGVITTMHETNLQQLVAKVSTAVHTLRSRGYTVQRYKIESTVYDSKYEDKFCLLAKTEKFDIDEYVRALTNRASYAERIRV